MTFSEALELLKGGNLIQREGWNGKGMHLYLEQGSHLPLSSGIEKGTTRIYEPVICMYTAQGTHQPGWLASQADILADDWGVLA